MCLRCRPSRARTACRCSAPASPPVAQGADRGPAGRDAGGDRVVDALAGHRVDQARRVAGEQQPAVGLLPPPAGQRQVVALPVLAGVDRAGQQLLELVEQQRPGRWVALAVGRQQLAVARRSRGRRRGRTPRRTPAAGGRRSGSPGCRAGPAGWARSRGSPAPGGRTAVRGARGPRSARRPRRRRSRPRWSRRGRSHPGSSRSRRFRSSRSALGGTWRRGPRPARPAGRRRPRAG